jgi:hypothetical protein
MYRHDNHGGSFAVLARAFPRYQLLQRRKRALQNFKGIKDLKSWFDFKKWHNRQLYLEKEAETWLTTSGVKIGDKFYSLKNVQDIPEAVKNNFTDFFKDDFSETVTTKFLNSCCATRTT